MRKRFTEEQIVKILQEHAEGKTVGGKCVVTIEYPKTRFKAI